MALQVLKGLLQGGCSLHFSGHHARLLVTPCWAGLPQHLEVLQGSGAGLEVAHTEGSRQPSPAQDTELMQPNIKSLRLDALPQHGCTPACSACFQSRANHAVSRA